MFFQQVLKENCGWQKLETLLHNVIVQLASHLDVLYYVGFSFRSNGSQWRSICVFGAYIQVSLTQFFGGPYCSRQGIFPTFCKFLLNWFNYALYE